MLNLQFAANTQQGCKFFFTRTPLEALKGRRQVLSLQLQLWKEQPSSNWVLGSRRRRSSPESGKTDDGAGQGGGENRAGAHHGSDGG
jgi:hypothetical protein